MPSKKEQIAAQIALFILGALMIAPILFAPVMQN